MDEIQAMSDAQLRAELVKHGQNVGPVTGTTRGVFEKKLLKLRQNGPPPPKVATPKPKRNVTPPPPVRTAGQSVRRSTRKNANRSENEEGSDDEVEILSPKQNVALSARKPVSSTPTRERTPSPPPSSKRKPGRPANSIIPGLNTTLNSSLNSVKSTTITTSKLFVSPGGDQPGSTPPRKIPPARTPPRSITQATTPPSLFDPMPTISPKFSAHSSSATRRNLSTLGHTTEEDDDSDAGEESSRIVHNIASTGRDRRSAVRRALDGFLGNELSAGEHPGSKYELRRGTVRTNVVRDARTGRVSVKQRSVWSDIPRMLLLILVSFFVVLGIAYIVASRPENFSSTVTLVKSTVKDTFDFFFKYAVLPVAIVAGASVLIAGLYFAHKWYREKQAREQEAFEDLVEQIIDMVQDETENGEENITVPHVRDKMYPPAKRSAADMARWERAVQFINENESRIATECALIRGQECQVWRWIPYKKSGWQGSAFPTPTANNSKEKSTDKYLSPNIPPIALTRCLKVRDVRENRDGKHPLEPINFDALKYQILEKIYPIRPVHLQFDPQTKNSILYIKCNNREDAKDVFDSLHAKWFNGHLITVKYMTKCSYNARFPFTSNC